MSLSLSPKLARNSSKPKSVVLVDDGKYFVPNLPTTLFEKISAIISGKFVIANWLYPLFSLNYLAKRTPVSFTAQGGVKLVASKYFLLGIPFFSTLIMVYFHHSACNPETISYQVKLDGKNVRKIYLKGKNWSRIKCLILQCALFATAYVFVERSSKPSHTQLKLLSSSIIGTALVSVFGYGVLRYFLKA